MPRVILIAALERSGSTIFDLVLGHHPNVISLGEVERVIKPHSHSGLDDLDDRQCTCGEPVLSCPFWGVVVERLRAAGVDSLADRYRIFFGAVDDVFGEDQVVVDSSKTIHALKAAALTAQTGFSVLHLIRDVRGWTSSIRQAEKRKRELPWRRILEPNFRPFWVSYIRHNILRTIPGFVPVEWALRNHRLMRLIRANGWPCRTVTYDLLALNPQQTLDRLFAFLDLDSIDLNQVGAPTHHIVRGNRTAFSGRPVLPLRYDHSWFGRPPTPADLVLYPVYLLNRAWLYRSD